MIEPQIYRTETEIRRVIEEHLAALVKEKQEVRISRKGGSQVTGAVESYIPRGDTRHDPDDQDALYVETRYRSGHVFQISEIETLEVLSTRRMTSSLALRQIKEMEHAAGIDKNLTAP
jgi:hypothetical protein